MLRVGFIVNYYSKIIKICRIIIFSFRDCKTTCNCHYTIQYKSFIVNHDAQYIEQNGGSRIIILIKYYTYTWCAGKYLKLCKIIMQGQILLSYLFICYIVLLYFFDVKPIKPISMKSNVCNCMHIVFL
jgi:hypothetical protein